MSRRKKLVFGLVAVVFAGAFAMIVWRPTRGELHVSYMGMSDGVSNRAIFALSNSSKASFFYMSEAKEMDGKPTMFPNPRGERTTGRIGPLGTTNLDCPVRFTNRWRCFVFYYDPSAKPIAADIRHKVSRYALNKGWERIALTLSPTPEQRLAAGPIMLGNKPAPVPR